MLACRVGRHVAYRRPLFRLERDVFPGAHMCIRLDIFYNGLIAVDNEKSFIHCARLPSIDPHVVTQYGTQ